MQIMNGEVRGAWFALYTRHQHEKVVEQCLHYKGFEVFLPLYVTVRRWKDRSKHLTVPLFPCYVFVKAATERRLAILTIPGVHDFVTSAGVPIAVSPIEIDALRSAVERGAGVEPHPFLKCGDRVRVKSGPLAGLEGFLVRKKNAQCRLVVSLEMLGKAASVEIDSCLVERTKAQLVGRACLGQSLSFSRGQELRPM